MGVYAAVGVAHNADVHCIHAFTDNQAIVKTALATTTGTSQSSLLRLQHNDDDDVVYCLGARAQIVLRGRLVRRQLRYKCVGSDT